MKKILIDQILVVEFSNVDKKYISLVSVYGILKNCLLVEWIYFGHIFLVAILDFGLFINCTLFFIFWCVNYLKISLTCHQLQEQRPSTHCRG